MGEHFRTDPKLTLKLFETLISPILLYGSEIWGVDTNVALDRDPIESIQTKLCKMLLGVNKNASNNACRCELGRYPIRMKAKMRSFSFWLKFLDPEQSDKLSCKAYHEIEMNDGKVFWSQKLKNILNNLGLRELWINKNNTFHNRKKVNNIIRQRLQDIELC